MGSEGGRILGYSDEGEERWFVGGMLPEGWHKQDPTLVEAESAPQDESGAESGDQMGIGEESAPEEPDTDEKAPEPEPEEPPKPAVKAKAKAKKGK